MGIPISYMGTKRGLAPAVIELADKRPTGPLLDLFAGMCSVGAEASRKRPVWVNDLQVFASEVGLALFCSKSAPVTREDAFPVLYNDFLTQSRMLNGFLRNVVSIEETANRRNDFNLSKKIMTQAALEEIDRNRNNIFSSTEYCLFSTIYSASYFGVSQCIEIDSAIFSIDNAVARSDINSDQARWLKIALAISLNKCSTSTGHFAQHLTPSQGNSIRFHTQRRKSIFSLWLDAIDQINLINSEITLKSEKNRSYNFSAEDLLDKLSQRDAVPSVIYADPPYTDDQYSRYYHLYETLFLYDYPETSGKGRYRTGRAASSFSTKTRVEESMRNLIEKSSALGSDLIISYPSDGLLENSTEQIPNMMKEYFDGTIEAISLPHTHSTMGGGTSRVNKRAVTEMLYRGSHYG